jgi:hypothetical protein
MKDAVYIHAVEKNTFTFYVIMGEKSHNVKVVHHADWSGTVLAENFPNGSTSTIRGMAPVGCKTPEECVNWVAPKLLANWKNI